MRRDHPLVLHLLQQIHKGLLAAASRAPGGFVSRDQEVCVLAKVGCVLQLSAQGTRYEEEKGASARDWFMHPKVGIEKTEMNHPQRSLLFSPLTVAQHKAYDADGRCFPASKSLGWGSPTALSHISAVENLRDQVTFLRILYTNNREFGAQAWLKALGEAAAWR